MLFRRWTRGARLSIARLPVGIHAPERPAHTYRDPWAGDAEQGARLIAGYFLFDGKEYRLPRGDWESGPWPETVREWLHGFTWLRDLRTLGSDDARLTARALVAEWINHPPTDPLVRDACVTGSRLAAWLGNHEFCTASADTRFQRRLMDRVLVEGRTVAALLPLPAQGWRNLTALRGLLAAAMAAPEYSGFMARYLRYLQPELQRLLLADGVGAERSPEAQFQIVRELAEMSGMFRTTFSDVPPVINSALDKACPVLRALRHGDGGLAIFNGASERRSSDIEAVLAQGERQRVIVPVMPLGRFTRLSLGRSMLIVDSGPPAAAGYDRTAHAGTLSFEFSHHRHRLFVNCGSALSGGWNAALRGSPAHTLLVADGKSSSDFGADGSVTRRPAHVTCEHQTNGEAHWLDLSHDGYHAPLGTKWSRRLYFGADGEDLRGQEVIEGEREVSFALRFHVHPAVQVTQDDEDVILRVDGMIWRFRQEGGVMNVESSVYLARGRLEKTKQIVVTGLRIAALPVASEPPKDADKLTEAPKTTRQSLTWGLERVPE
ncbi:heparinase II/III family protein [Gluconobacter wancherniae]|uniref:heparinase II/III family protein n=1 Tax=Gluconobacter wancherniae TaxID=1307955 RepID=UPI001B8C91AE|nr:heparinase II/III family protein [Gluconobacter wancherniae]MBS1063553.1 heparinase II/III family protein [Gluconobacter wancherniae]